MIALVDVPEPPRWFVLLADAIDDVDFTGGKTLVELAQQLAERKVVFAVAEGGEPCCPELALVRSDKAGSARTTCSDRSTKRSWPSRAELKRAAKR